LGEPSEKYSAASAGRKTERERALLQAEICRGNSLPEVEIIDIVTVIELGFIGIIIIIITSTIITIITSPSHCNILS
jgi:hypothetical protein